MKDKFENNLKNIFEEKSFTILLSSFFVFALFSRFYGFEILASFLVLAILVFLVLRFDLNFKKAIILYLIFFLGILRADYKSNLYSPLEEIFSNNAEFKGQIVSSKNITNNNQKVKFFINIKEALVEGKRFENLNSKALASFDLEENLKDKITIGDYVKFKGKLRVLSPSSNPYQFDYKKYLENQDCKNIVYGDFKTFEVYKTPKISKNLEESWYFVLKEFELKRNEIMKKHSKFIKSPELEILGGIVFGNETINPDETIKEQFKASGLLHLLAASGLNVALIFGIWWQIATLFKLPYNLSILIGALFVVFYTFMTGFPPSILRAGIMLLFVLFGKLIDRKASSLALIFFVGFLILLFCPKMLFDIGFELSFMVTLGLILCCEAIVSKFDKIDKKYIKKYENSSKIEKYFRYLFSPKNLASVISVPLVAQIWVIPLQMHYFYNLAPMSIFANLATVPFVGVLSFVGFLSSILALIPIFSQKIVMVFDFLAYPLLKVLIKISEIFSSYKYSLVSTFGLNVFQIFLFWGLIVFFTLNLQHNFKNKKFFSIFIVSLFVFFFSFLKFDLFEKALEINMFDVQNADCFLIKTPKNKYILLDTGKKTYKGSTDFNLIVNPYLSNKRILSLDYLILTHFDSDHAGGALELLKNFKVKNIIIQKEEEKSKLSFEILKYLKENNLNYKIAKNNETILKEEDFEIKTLLPNLKTKNDNENSIVTLISYKNKNLLFMADVGVLGFKKIVPYLPNDLFLIKIGHHGAKNTINQELIEKFKPKMALVSVGQNKFNHPNIETINLLLDNNIRTLKSQNYGFLKMKFKGENLEISHFNSFDKKMEKLEFRKEASHFSKSSFVREFIKENN